MELLTVQDTAKLLKVSTITVRRFIAAGRLPAVKVGRAVRIEREAIAGLAKPVALHTPGTDRRTRPPVNRQRFTREDALWNIVGIADQPGDATDIAREEQQLLADAYADESR